MTVQSLPDVFTVAESATKSKVSAWSIRKAIADGDLRARYIGRCVRILDEDLGAWLRSRPSERGA